MAAPSRSQEQYIVRFPEGMRTMIKDAALKARRSMNAEIIYQLGRAYRSQEATGEGVGNRAPAASECTVGLASAGNIHNG